MPGVRWYALPANKRENLRKWPAPWQKPGAAPGQERWQKYLDNDLFYPYKRHLSRPYESRESCSHLSPYLARHTTAQRNNHERTREVIRSS